MINDDKKKYHKYCRPSDKITSITEFHEMPIGLDLAIATEKRSHVKTITLIISKALDRIKRNFFEDIHNSYVIYNIVYFS